MVEQFIITKDNDILTLMHFTVQYCLLRLYLAAGTSMADNEQDAAIKAHVRRTNTGGSDPDDDAWDTRNIYHSVRMAPCGHNVEARNDSSGPGSVRECPRKR
jgi:hypothetical protein